MGGFRCPFCGQVMSVNKSSITVRYFNFSEYFGEYYLEDVPALGVGIYHCPNCDNETVVARGYKGFCGNREVNIYPNAQFKRFPEYVPELIRRDYEEAVAIADISPRASAALARCCLQSMIRDFWDIHEESLNAEIDALHEKLDPTLWNAIDGIRRIGSIGDHMEDSIDIITETEPDEADMLIKLIELLVNEWYISRFNKQQLFRKIIKSGEEIESLNLNRMI